MKAEFKKTKTADGLPLTIGKMYDVLDAKAGRRPWQIKEIKVKNDLGQEHWYGANKFNLFVEASAFLKEPALPCEVGDKVYEIGVEENSIEEKQIENIVFQEQKVIIYAKDDTNAFCIYKVSDFGNSVFPTRQMAEAALGSIQGKG